MSLRSEYKNSCLSLHRVFRRLQQKNRFVGIVHHTGLTPLETHAILEIDSSPRISMGELSMVMVMDSSVITRVVQKFVRSQWVTSSQRESTPRTREFYLTPKGEQLCKKIDGFANSILTQLSAALSDAEQRSLDKYFARLASDGGVPVVPRRKSEPEYRVQQRRITRLFGLLGKSAWQTQLTSSEMQLLAEVCLSQVAPRISELAELLSLQSHSVVEIVGSLSERGWVKRVADARDARVSTIVPTARGSVEFSAAETQATSIICKATERWALSELHDFLEIAKKFVGCSHTETPPLLPSLLVVEVQSEEGRAVARGFIARTYVAWGEEDRIPAILLGSKERVFEILRDGRHLGVVTCRKEDRDSIQLHICASAELPQWSLFGAVSVVLGHLGREVTPSAVVELLKEAHLTPLYLQLQS
jgi:DNA-binding MarR family transcriptional regulator